MSCNTRCCYVERIGSTRYVERVGETLYTEQVGATRYVERGGCAPTAPTTTLDDEQVALDLEDADLD